ADGETINLEVGNSPATDQNQVGEDLMGLPESDTVTMSLIKLSAALLVVVIAIYAFLYMLRRMMGSKFSGNRGNRMIEVLETVYIAQKRSVSLIRFHDRAVLVGVGDSGIQPLAELTVEETARIIAEQTEGKPASGFISALGDARNKLKTWNTARLRQRDVGGELEKPQTA
ncbi:MAG: flagellar biosynthetic protein FliO, partial [Candidatus Zixiibacteriota bacterium]